MKSKVLTISTLTRLMIYNVWCQLGSIQSGGDAPLAGSHLGALIQLFQFNSNFELGRADLALGIGEFDKRFTIPAANSLASVLKGRGFRTSFRPILPLDKSIHGFIGASVYHMDGISMRGLLWESPRGRARMSARFDVIGSAYSLPEIEEARATSAAGLCFYSPTSSETWAAR